MHMKQKSLLKKFCDENATKTGLLYCLTRRPGDTVKAILWKQHMQVGPVCEQTSSVSAYKLTIAGPWFKERTFPSLS